MAKGRQKREQKRRKKLERQRRQRQNQTPPAKQLNPKLAQKLDDVYDLIRRRKFAEAEEQLDRLIKRSNRHEAVVGAQVFLYQETKDHQQCARAAKQLTRLVPRDPDARMLYAQESMFCGRTGIALANYRLFLQHWPDHANAKKAKNAIELLEPECESKIKQMGFGDACDGDAGLELLAMHDEVLEYVQNGRFDDAAEKCLELLKLAPDCMPARNNLSLSYFQSGQIEKAVHAAEETCHLAPDNRFAEATLGKLRFLCGQEDEANTIADRIVLNPPVEQDPLAATIELLSFLGRDEDVMVVSEAAEITKADPRCQAMVLHHLAVAQCRLGDEKAARASWKKCLRAMPTHIEARENLDDLDAGDGHAPWAESVAKWIPRAVCDEIFEHQSTRGKEAHLDLAKNYPAIASLIPALLDRGDPLGREIAMKLAEADGSPLMLDALQQFALGSRGPDAMRFKALNLLRRKGRVDAGPHRVFRRGKWTEIKLFAAEIDWEPTKCPPWERKLVETGTEAMNCRDFTLAEESFQKILDKNPDSRTAAYNLCVIWLERDGLAGRRRARTRLEEICQQFPDYYFAPISLAQFAAMDGDYDRAGQLLQPVLDATRLHASEAIALFTSQIQIAVKRREFESAEHAFSLLAQIAGGDDPKVIQLRRIIDTAQRGGLRGWLSQR